MEFDIDKACSIRDDGASVEVYRAKGGVLLKQNVYESEFKQNKGNKKSCKTGVCRVDIGIYPHGVKSSLFKNVAKVAFGKIADILQVRRTAGGKYASPSGCHKHPEASHKHPEASCGILDSSSYSRFQCFVSLRTGTVQVTTLLLVNMFTTSKVDFYSRLPLLDTRHTTEEIMSVDMIYNATQYVKVDENEHEVIALVDGAIL